MAKYDNFSSKSVTSLGRRIGEAATLHLASRLDRFAPQARRVLEIGPGVGVLARYYRERGCEYVCYEPNAALADGLERAGVAVRRQTAPPIAETSDTYDAAIAAHVLEHMPSPDLAYQLVSELTRAVRRGGVVVLAAPDFNQWQTLFYDCDYTHSYPVTPDRIRQIMVDVGLELMMIEHRYGSLGGPLGWTVDRAVRCTSWPISQFTSASHRLMKATMLFRPILVAVGRKP